MKKEIAAKWVEALRSGKYSQTQSMLRNSEGYCCLGVLCDLAQKEGIGSWGMRDSVDTDNRRFDGAFYFSTKDNGDDKDDDNVFNDNIKVSRRILPTAVCEWAGINTSESGNNGSFTPEKVNGSSSLSALNDTGFTFEQIAEVITDKVELL